MHALLVMAALGEAATGLALVVVPSLVVNLLFGAEISGVGMVITRICGISLIALGIACWPGGGTLRALCGMLTYSTLAGLYLLYLGISGHPTGKALWPAVAAHLVLSLLLLGLWFKAQKSLRVPSKRADA